MCCVAMVKHVIHGLLSKPYSSVVKTLETGAEIQALQIACVKAFKQCNNINLCSTKDSTS